jgi:FtsP/CotA-like multicopper oxidase with cupredoxin domain
MSRSDLVRRGLAVAVVGGAVGLAVTAWASSLLGEYSVMAMGYVETGQESASAEGHAHGAHTHGAAAGASTSVTTLVADPTRPADVRYTLVARQGKVLVGGGRTVDGYTVNGSSPGPVLRAQQGQLVEVTLVNESVGGGTTLHWHGVEVPNAADGVAGITQDAVPVGGRYVYRFVASHAGTFWYHSHQMSHEQVMRGLLGALVVEPARRTGLPAVDRVALLHVYGGQHTLNGSVADEHVRAAPGARVRLRVVNTDMGTAAVWASHPYRVMATDGREVNAPTEVSGRRALVPAGGRLDIEVTAPSDGSGVRVRVGGQRSVLVGGRDGGGTGTGATSAQVPQPRATLDLLSYGTPTRLGFDPNRPDRRFDYVIGRRLGFLDGRPGSYWTINGHLFPDVPMFHVREGEVAQMRIVNDSDEVHPMHLHGHHVVVLSRDGVASSGSTWWADSLDVRAGETYVVAFVADNPGIWADHCHTLSHATGGLVTHLMYEGVSTPFLVGGRAANLPE